MADEDGLKAQKLLAQGSALGNVGKKQGRPERAEAPSPGQHPGLRWTQACRPVRAKAFKYQAIYKALALTGRLTDCYYTQGDALG